MAFRNKPVPASKVTNGIHRAIFIASIISFCVENVKGSPFLPAAPGEAAPCDWFLAR